MITYRQYQTSCHAAGGETQTEAAAKMTNLASFETGFLDSVLDGLRKEAAMAATFAEYQPIRHQIRRFRLVRLTRPL